MIDVLELARQRRAVLLKEIETLNRFIATGMRLAEGPVTSDLLLSQVSLDTAAEEMPELAASADAPASNSVAIGSSNEAQITPAAAPQSAGTEAGPPAGSSESPIDSLIFKRMLSEMRRKHQDQMFAEREKVAASG